MNEPNSPKRSGFLAGWSRARKVTAAIALLLALYTVLGFFLIPAVAKKVLENKLPQLLHRPVSIGKISLNPYSLVVAVEGFRLGHKDGKGDLFAFARLEVNLESSSLFRRALVISSMSLSDPLVDFSRLEDQTYSFSDLLVKDRQPEKEKEGGPFHFAISNIVVSGGRILFHDLPKKTEHTVTDLRLGIPSISNLPSQVEVYVKPEFAAVINGTPFSVGGESRPFAKSLETVADLKATGIKIPEYLAYIPNPSGLALRSALLDVDAELHIRLRPDNTYRLAVIGRMALRDLVITDRSGKTYLKLPELGVTMDDSDLLAGEVHLKEVSLDSPAVIFERTADGAILPVALLTRTGEEEKTAKPGPALGDTGNNESQKGKTLKLNIDKIVLKGGRLDFLDAAVGASRKGSSPAHLGLSNLALQVDSLSNSPDELGKFETSVVLNEAGRFEAHGVLGLAPVRTSLKLKLEKLALKPFQPYISKQARLVVAGGELSGAGDLSLNPKNGGGLRADFRGEADLARLATLDTVLGEDLLKWRNLGLKKIHFSSDPNRLSIAEINLAEPYAKVLISKGGVLNLATLRPEKQTKEEVKGPPDSPAKPGAATAVDPPFAAEIGTVTSKGGRLDFEDHSVSPAYGSSLDKITGKVGALSSAAGTSAPVDLSARLNGVAPLKIAGRINPLSKKLYIALKIDFNDINLTDMTPYTVKYLGYDTDKGKLNLDLKYDINGSRLVSDNKAFLDQFTLGKAVKSPDALKLPISLAIALLKNREGEIHLDVPVEGDLSDPNFRVAGVIIQVLVNLVAKAATSPFALLADLIPAGQDLQYIAFKAGTADLEQPAKDKLATLVKVLYERPGLKMDIVGKVDQTTDGAALARLHLLNMVRLQKAEAVGMGGKEEAENLEVSGKEYPVYLAKAYQAAIKADRSRKPPKGEATVASMEAYLLAGIKVSADELRLLALERANRVMEGLVASGKVEPDRLFVVAPQLGGAGEGGGASQVELVIK